MEDCTLQISNGSQVSSRENPSDPDYNPIYLILDSTITEPAPSDPIELRLSLPSGYYCEEAEIRFRGTTAAYWEITKDDPAFEPVWYSSVVTSVNGNEDTTFYVRASTIFEEVPVRDRSVALEVVGEVRARGPESAV